MGNNQQFANKKPTVHQKSFQHHQCNSNAFNGCQKHFISQFLIAATENLVHAYTSKKTFQVQNK